MDQPQQTAFATPIGTDQGHTFVFTQRQINVVQDRVSLISHASAAQ
jgi:hypothetical protein